MTIIATTMIDYEKDEIVLSENAAQVVNAQIKQYSLRDFNILTAYASPLPPVVIRDQGTKNAAYIENVCSWPLTIDTLDTQKLRCWTKLSFDNAIIPIIETNVMVTNHGMRAQYLPLTPSQARVIEPQRKVYVTSEVGLLASAIFGFGIINVTEVTLTDIITVLNLRMEMEFLTQIFDQEIK